MTDSIHGQSTGGTSIAREPLPGGDTQEGDSHQPRSTCTNVTLILLFLNIPLSFVTFSLKMVILDILSKTRYINKLHLKTIPDPCNWQEATCALTIKKIH